MEAYSFEDEGKGICFNRFCYNHQPGIDIQYSSGDSKRSLAAESAMNTDNSVIPFAASNPTNETPDLIYALDQSFSILFRDQIGTPLYDDMRSRIESAASEARSLNLADSNKNEYFCKLKQYEHEYREILEAYIPQLLAKETFFNSVFTSKVGSCKQALPPKGCDACHT